MRRTTLGDTGIEAVQLGFGGIPIQRLRETEAVEVVLYALEKGMDFIDTSRMYTTSESRIGLALRETGAKVTLATKSYSRSADGIRRDVETSLRELQRDYIDLYQCHGISSREEYRMITAPGGALSGLCKAKQEGLIGHIGVTGHNLDVLETILDDGLFETIMVCLSFLEPAATELVIPKARDRHVGIIAMKPFSGGVIEAAETALKWVFSFPDILVLAGVEKKEYIDQNWRAFLGSHDLTGEDLQVIERIRSENDKTFCRRCDYCLPCPEGIPIQVILGARSFIRRMGAGILKDPKVAQMWERAANCTGCGDCMQRCPYGLPIPEMIRENVDWMNAYMHKLHQDPQPDGVRA